MAEEQVADGYHKKFTGMLVGPDGTRRWFIDGAYGRNDDLPCVEYPDGGRCWYAANPKRGGFGQRDALEHRDNGPAVIRADGSRIWYQMGKVHRGDGLPAMEMADGTRKWFENGVWLRFEPGSGAGETP